MKKCTQCGQMLNDDAKFCFKCGSGSFEAVPEASNATYQQPQYQPPQYQPPVQQNVYAQQPYQSPMMATNNEPVSVGMFLLFFILNMIPVVGFVFTIVVAVSSSFKKSYTNMARAYLIMIAIGIVLTIVMAVTMGAFFGDIYKELMRYYY